MPRVCKIDAMTNRDKKITPQKHRYAALELEANQIST